MIAFSPFNSLKRTAHKRRISTLGDRGRKELEKMGYIHKIRIAVVKEEDEEILHNVHRIASLLKRWLLGIHQIKIRGYYLDEYVFRYNRRTSNSRGLLFMKLHEHAVITEPVTYNEIIKENHGY